MCLDAANLGPWAPEGIFLGGILHYILFGILITIISFLGGGEGRGRMAQLSKYSPASLSYNQVAFATELSCVSP